MYWFYILKFSKNTYEYEIKNLRYCLKKEAVLKLQNIYY